MDAPRSRRSDHDAEDDATDAAADLDADIAAALSRVVSGEAMKTLADQVGEGDPARLAEGWERRFLGDAARAEEAVALYEELGYEVVADVVTPTDLAEGCKDCELLSALQFKVIYTRVKRGF